VWGVWDGGGGGGGREREKKKVVSRERSACGRVREERSGMKKLCFGKDTGLVVATLRLCCTWSGGDVKGW